METREILQLVSALLLTLVGIMALRKKATAAQADKKNYRLAGIFFLIAAAISWALLAFRLAD